MSDPVLWMQINKTATLRRAKFFSASDTATLRRALHFTTPNRKKCNTVTVRRTKPHYFGFYVIFLKQFT